jgi:uncharacterized repeat protein (TIGR01451 family)/fimbrial isopeptide formation D2 family protein
MTTMLELFWRAMRRHLVLLAAVPALLTLASSTFAQTPPQYDGVTYTQGCSTPPCPAAIAPQPWPAENLWIPYSWGTTYPDPLGSGSIEDPKVQDPSNGGTSPQNYVNVSSGACTDKILPSIYYYYNPATQMIYFRWRVEQIANSYAIGPSPGTYGNTEPWKSALWTVFFSITGTGYRDFAAHLDGSSGDPSKPVDVLRSIWSAVQSNSIDFVSTPGIYSLYTNPTAFVSTATGQIVQFDGNAVPTVVQWPNGASETVWDYGTTRLRNVSIAGCSEYFVDYEIPRAMLNATAVGGPVLSEYTPFQFLFATANSLNNPFQKDVVWEGSFVCDASAPGPFGDAVQLNGGIIPQPITTKISAGTPNGCSAPVTAQIMDALNVNNCQSITQLVQAQFKYWYDTNANGLADEPTGQWFNIGDPTTPVATVVTADWNLTNLIQGQYLLALEISDTRGHTTQTWMGKASPTLTQEFGTDNNGPGGTLRHLYTNVPPIQPTYPFEGIQAATHGISYLKVQIGGACGAPLPAVTKTSNAGAGIQQGQPVTYTLTLNNTSGTAITVSSITDTLPTGFTYQSTAANAAPFNAPTSSPTVGATGTITWTFSPAVTVAGPSAPTFTFTANAGTSGGTFFNSGTFVTNVGNLTGTDTTGVPVRTANLLVTKTASLTSAPGVPVAFVNRGDSVRFSFTVTNNSQTAVTGITVSDPLPSGFTYVGGSASPAPTSAPANGANGTITWGPPRSLSANGGTQTFFFDAIATTPGAKTNTVTVTSTEAATVQASASLSVNGPVLAINKTGSTTSIIAPISPATVIVDMVIQYANIGNADATGVTLTDALPATGWTLQIGAGTTTGCTQTGTTVNCNSTAVPTTLPAGVTRSVNLRFAVGATAPNPSGDTATVSSTGIPSAQDSWSVAIDANACTTTNYYFRTNTGAVSSGVNGYGVGYVNMTNNGAGYTSAGTVTFSAPPAGTTATGTPTGGAGNGQILGVNLGVTGFTGGSGYVTAPTVTFAGGGFTTQAQGTAVLTDNQRLALTTAGAANTNPQFTVGTMREIIRFYSDPADSTSAHLISSASVTTGWNFITGNKLEYQVVLADFNPDTNAYTTIATASETNINPPAGDFTRTVNYTIAAPGYLLPAGHRLAWIVSAADSNNNHATVLQFLYNGASSPFQSRGTVCMQPARMSLSKHADKLIFTPGADTLTYTLQYRNNSGATITGVQVTDTIPTGMTYLTSTPSTGSINVVGQNLTWTIGSVAGGATGTATVTVQTLSSIAGTSVTNTGTLSSNQTPNVNASVDTVIGRPNVLISKRASGNSFVPGNSFTYTVDVVNAGNGLATGVDLTDTLPAYIAATSATGPTTSIRTISVTGGGSGYVTPPVVSITGGGGSGAAANAVLSGGAVSAIVVTNPGTGYTSAPTVTIAAPPAGTTATATATLRTIVINNPTVTFNIGSLTAGNTASLTINVTISTSGVPAGQNTAINTAQVVDDYDPVARTATATVTVTAFTALTLTQTATPSANRVVFVNVTAGGAWTTVPTVSFTGCTTPPTAVVSTNPVGALSGPYTVTGVTITNPGSGCTDPVLVSFIGTGAGAVATATVGPAPGDTITYQLTLTSTGNADATGCVITGTVPTNTAYTSGGTFSGGVVTQNAGTLTPGSSSVLTYVVTVNSGLPYSYSSPFGVTTLTQAGSATSTNTTAPPNTGSTLSTGTSPRYTITDTPDGEVVAFPLSTLGATVSNATTITVSNPALINVGDTIAIFNGSTYDIAKVTGKGGFTITLDTPVSGTAGTNILPVQQYTLAYGNAGGGTGQNVTVSDILPAGLLFGGIVSNGNATFLPGSSPAVGANGTLNWSVGTLSNGETGIIQFLAFPTAAGVYTNTAIITDGTALNTRNAYDTAATTFGALDPAKLTTTATRIAGEIAHYTITIQNPLPSTAATSVVVTDNLPSGFTYVPGTTTGAGEPTCGSPCSSPVWNIASIPAGGSLTIGFDALVAASTPTGTYQNEVLVTSSIPSLVFDYTATTVEDVYVCSAAQPITAPTACANSTGNVASIAFRPQATYSWSINNGAVITTSSTGTVNSITLGSGGSGYTGGASVVISGGGGTGATATATVTGGVVTAITMVNPGSGYTSTPTVTINPVTVGSGANAAAVLGTGIIYTAGSVSPTISVLVTEGICSVTSQATPSVIGPVITTQPSSRTVCGSQNVNFTVTASNATGFQWQISTNGGASWANVSTGSGGTTNSYTYPATAPGDAGHQFRVLVSGAGCTTTSTSATLSFACAPDLEMTTNSDSPDPVAAGANITYTQLFTNIGPNATDQTITITETIPPNTTFVSFTPPANFSCTGVPAVGGTGTFTCTSNTSIASGANSGSFSLVVKTGATVATGTTTNDTVSVSTPNDTNVANNSNTATTTINRSVDIQTSFNDDAFTAPYGAHFLYPGNPPSNQPLQWYITVANTGMSRASNIVFTDPLPFGYSYSNVTLTPGSLGSCDQSGGTISCTIPTLDPTPAVTISGGGGTGATAVATVNAAGQITGIVITNPGSGYTSAPTVTITTNGTGSGGTATATINGSGDVSGITVNDAGTGYTTTPLITIIGQATVNSTQLLNAVSTISYSETDVNPANDKSDDTVIMLAPTVVKMVTMDAVQTNKGVTITWNTSFEQDNIGFFVWRERSGSAKEQASKQLIPGGAFVTAHRSPNAKRSYRFFDAPPKSGQFVQYWVEDVDMNGVRTMHGPITPAIKNDATTGGGETEPDPSVNSVGGIFTTAAGMGVLAPEATAPDAQRLAQQWALAAVSGAKIVITQPGWYSIKKSDLVAAGFDPGNNTQTLSLFADGVEVPIAVSGNGNFGSNDTIEFYGSGVDTPAGGPRVYYLRKGVGKALRVDTTKQTGGGLTAPASTPFTFTRIERTVHVSSLTNTADRDNWFGAMVWMFGPSSNALTVKNLDRGAGNATLEVALQGSATVDHFVTMTLNGHSLGTVEFGGFERKVSTFSIPESWLVDGENTLAFSSSPADWMDISLVDYAKLTYAHKLVADSNALAFSLPASTAATVGGFTTANVRVVDLTDPSAPVFLPVTVATATDGTKSASFSSTGTGTRTIFAFGADRVMAPAQVVVNAASSLNASKNAADLVIISHKSFLGAANALKAARDAQGISTVVVDVQNLYDEFSYGKHAPEAIRAFLQRAAASWSKAPKYVVLLGDASFDSRNHLGFGTFDFVPTKLITTQYLKTASDDWFADFNDTGIPSMAIGRLPARTEAEANGMVAKLVRRATPPTDAWAKTVDLIVDYPNGVPFDKSADLLKTLVPAAYSTDRISFATATNPSAAVVNAFTQGSLLTNYIGHGSNEIWSSFVFTSSAAAALTNGDKLPFVVVMNCLNGRFNDVYTESLGEALMKNANGGAVGVWASSALTSPDQQHNVNMELYRQIFGGTSTAIGDAILKAKQATGDRDVRRTWILFGDPTMRLK